jgi:hypothetical protein
VLEGTTPVPPDGKQIPSLAGDVRINQRDVPHGRFKVAGDKPLKMLTVCIGDKGKPLTEPAKETIAVQYIATPALVQTAHVQSLPTTSRSHCQMMPVTSPSISSTATQISAEVKFAI